MEDRESGGVNCRFPTKRRQSLNFWQRGQRRRCPAYGGGNRGAFSERAAGSASYRFDHRYFHLDAVANDFGFETIFARQVEALGRKGDVFIGISTSGNSPTCFWRLDWLSSWAE